MSALQALVPAPSSGDAPANTIFTPRRRAKFCEQLAVHGNVRLACRAAGVSAQTAYRARRACADLAACWDAALLLARDAAEQVLADRAINGVEEAVYYHGEEVAVRRRYDSRLLLAHLARLDRVADKPEAQQAAGEFDSALERLEQGEAVLARSAAGDAVGPAGGDVDEEDLPPVEAALRWLEAQRGEVPDDEFAEDGADACAEADECEGANWAEETGGILPP